MTSEPQRPLDGDLETGLLTPDRGSPLGHPSLTPDTRFGCAVPSVSRHMTDDIPASPSDALLYGR